MRFRLFYTFLFFLLNVSNQAGGQQFNPYYNFKHLSTENGLVDDIVYHFLQDNFGYMWLGTRNGIGMFDGTRVLNFQHNDLDRKGISGNFITRILEDSDHHVWVGTNAGIDLFNRIDNSFTHFGVAMSNGTKENAYCVPLGFSGQKDLWLIDTREKAIKIFNTYTKKFKLILPTDAVDGSMYCDKATRIVHVWSYLSIGTTHYVFRNDSLITRESFFNQEKNREYPSLKVFHVLYTGDSTAWISTSKGLVDLNIVSRKYCLYNIMNNDPVPESRCAAIAQNGLLWIGTGGHGVYTFDLTSKKFVAHFDSHLLDPLSICSNNIVSLYFDKVGNVWCGSYGSGVSYTNVEATSFSKYLSKPVMDKWEKNNKIAGISEDPNENIWCLFQDATGILKLDSSLKIKSYLIPKYTNGKPFRGAIYQLLFDQPTKAWMVSDHGLYRFDPALNIISRVNYYKFSSALFGSSWVNYMITLDDHSLLFSTFGGIYRITKQSNGHSLIQPFSELNLNTQNGFEIIYQDREKNIYVKDIGDSLFVLRLAKKPDGYNVEKRIRFPEREISFAESDSDIYIGSSQGLYIIHKKDLTMERSAINGMLPSRNIRSVIYKNRALWLLCDKGLCYYNTTEKKSRLYTVEDGLPSNSFSNASLIMMKCGKYIAGTNNGLVAFTPDKINDSMYAPRAQLIRFSVNDSAKSFILNPQAQDSVSLTHAQNTFSIDFSCIAFQHISACSYEYKLDHYDEQWIKTSYAQNIRYSKISPGLYDFRLRVIDAKGKVSPYTKTLLIEVKKAFWQTEFFKLIVIGIVMGLIWLLIRYYLSLKINKQQRIFEKQQAIEKERTRIATDMHDDLGAGLSRIKFLSETIGIKKQKGESVEEDINKIRDYSHEMIGKMGEIVWALNEKNDTLSDLFSFTRSYAVEYLSQNGIECKVEEPDQFPPIFVSGEFRRNMFLIVKEALHNVVKHAQADHVEIRIAVDHVLRVCIQDDGIGFDRNNIRPLSNGLSNMVKRIEEIGGSIAINNDHGTSVIVKVPLAD